MADEHDRSGPSTLLFHDVQFAIVLSDGLAEHEAHEVLPYNLFASLGDLLTLK